MDELAQRINRSGIAAGNYSHASWRSVADQAISDYRRDPKPIAVVGHSIGGNSAIQFAQALGAARVPVSLLITYDPDARRRQRARRMSIAISISISPPMSWAAVTIAPGPASTATTPATISRIAARSFTSISTSSVVSRSCWPPRSGPWVPAEKGRPCRCASCLPPLARSNCGTQAWRFPRMAAIRCKVLRRATMCRSGRSRRSIESPRARP